MYLPLPQGTLDDLVSTQLLADDEMLSQFEVHPGDEVNCLGYPLGNMSNQSGFPILRSGKIASYPLWPTRDTRVFSLDMRVFPGNSGGPVYLSESNRIYGGATHIGKVQMLLGVVATWTLAQKLVPELFSQRLETYPLDVAQVVHASLIKEAIEMLPPPTDRPR
jgi:S1-C subfamily serine protease